MAVGDLFAVTSKAPMHSCLAPCWTKSVSKQRVSSSDRAIRAAVCSCARARSLHLKPYAAAYIAIISPAQLLTSPGYGCGTIRRCRCRLPKQHGRATSSSDSAAGFFAAILGAGCAGVAGCEGSTADAAAAGSRSGTPNWKTLGEPDVTPGGGGAQAGESSATPNWKAARPERDRLAKLVDGTWWRLTMLVSDACEAVTLRGEPAGTLSASPQSGTPNCIAPPCVRLPNCGAASGAVPQPAASPIPSGGCCVGVRRSARACTRWARWARRPPLRPQTPAAGAGAACAPNQRVRRKFARLQR